MSNRREFIIRSAFAGSTLLLAQEGDAKTSKPAGAQSSKPLRMLLLGGTGFIGSHFVQAAIARGHQVAVFSRGETGTKLPATVEQLLGDRGGNLGSIKNRDWDAVFDLATYVPNWVRTLGNALRGRVVHYTFISSILAYRFPGATDERSKLEVYAGAEDPYELTSFRSLQEYGALKVLCELEAEKQFPMKVLTLRPGTIVGPREKGGNFTYWTARLARGGEVLAAGEPLAQVQLIDVRDLAEWAIRSAESNRTGAFTAAGPVMPLSWSEMLGGVRAALSIPMKLTWVPLAWLKERGLGQFNPLIFWPGQCGIPGSTELIVDKAAAHGLTFRPFSITAADTLSWYQSLLPEQQRKVLAGIDHNSQALDDSIAREAELLAAWHRRKA